MAEYAPTGADMERAREALAGLLVEYSDTDGPVTSYTTGPADGDEDAVLNLAERFAKVRADERAKLQDRIEELEKNLSYEVEQKIKLADTLRVERAKRPDRAALERIAAECEADIPYDDGNETAKLIGKRIREALALEPETREIPDAEVAAAYSAFVQASFGFPGAPAMRAALEAARDA